jgi:hypothetical protein
MTVLLAAASAVHLPLPQTAFVISLGSDVLSIVAGSALLRRAGWPLAAIMFGVMVALSPVVVHYSVSGLETSLYVALLISALELLEQDRPYLLGATLAALVLCRIDGAFMAGICAVAVQRRPSAIRTYAVGAAILGAWGTFSLAYFHTLVPMSVQAKAHLRATVETSWSIFRGFFFTSIYIPLSLLAVPGAVALARRGGIALRVAILWWIAYAAIFIVTGAFSAFPWYFVPLLPIYFAAAGAALEVVVTRIVPSPRLPAACAAVAVFAAAFLGWRVTLHRQTMDVWLAEREGLYRQVAERVVDRRDCTLAATEIGALGYYYRGPMLDLVGLVSPEAIGRPFADTIAAARPCWIVSYSDLLGPAPDGYGVRFMQPINHRRTLLVLERR